MTTSRRHACLAPPHPSCCTMQYGTDAHNSPPGGQLCDTWHVPFSRTGSTQSAHQVIHRTKIKNVLRSNLVSKGNMASLCPSQRLDCVHVPVLPVSPCPPTRIYNSLPGKDGSNIASVLIMRCSYKEEAACEPHKRMQRCAGIVPVTRCGLSRLPSPAAQRIC